jgi:hypothetical protein
MQKVSLEELQADLPKVLVALSRFEWSGYGAEEMREMDRLIDKMRLAESQGVCLESFYESILDIWQRARWGRDLGYYLAYKKVSINYTEQLKARWRGEKDQSFRFDLECVVKTFLDNGWQEGTIDIVNPELEIRARWGEPKDGGEEVV